MFDLKKIATRTAIATLLAVSPMALMAQATTGSPAQSVEADPDEEVAGTSGVNCSIVADDAKTDGGESGCGDATVVDNTDGSLVESDAKSDG